MNLEGLIFDCDGTLADTMPLHWRAWRHVSRKHDFEFSEERFYALGGVPGREIIRMINREQRLDLDPAAVAREKEETYLPLLSQARPIEPILRIAQEHHGKLPMAVASGGTHDIISRVLNHLGIGSLFQALVTSEEVRRPKPAPDIFVEAARRIKADPARCRAYEDSDLGLRAIRAAGMNAVDVRPLIQKTQDRG